MVAILIRFLYIVRYIFEIRSKKEFNLVLNTDEEVAEQIPNLNIVKSPGRELCYFIFEIVLILATLVVLVIAVVTLIRESHWIKDMFTNSCTEDHLNWVFRDYEDRVD